MVKTLHKAAAIFLAVLMLVPLFSFGSSAATTEEDKDQALYIEKYVSVLYDNSGSMTNSDKRQYYATYAFKMLASMMSENDTLWVTPMNKGGAPASINDVVTFPFTSDRESDIATFTNKHFGSSSSLTFGPNGNTPLTSISVAVERLFKTDDIENYDETRERKRWLVIMTDGIFTDENKKEVKIETSVNEIVRVLDEYPEMNVIYLGMGAAADLSGTEYVDSKDNDAVKQNPLAAEKYKGRFYGKMANTADNIVASMRDVINLMSDRYTLTSDKADFITVSPDGLTATVKLTGEVAFPLSSISFAVQNFGGKLVKATYAGLEFTPDNCKITAPTELNMQSGATGIIRNPNLFNTSDSTGDLVLYFDKPITKEKIALMAEPSLYIRPYFLYEQNGAWVEGTEIDIMKRVQAGGKIKVGYRVYNGANDRAYTDMNAQPLSEANATLYVRNAFFQDGLTGVSDPITLQDGSNQIKLNVSLMKGVYRLEKTVDIKIIGSTAGYKLQATHTPADSSAPHLTESVFKPMEEVGGVFVPMTKDALSAYTSSVRVTNMEGVAVAANATTTLRDDGTYLVSLDLSSQPFGEYMLEFTLTHKLYPITMADKTLPQYYPAKIELGFEGDSEITKTQNSFERGQHRAITFTLSADGKKFDFDNGLLQYELKFGNTVIDKTKYSVSGNKLSFVPDKETVGALLGKDPAEYPITLTVSSQTRPSLAANTTAKLILTETQLEVLVVKNDLLPIDRFDIQDTPAEVYFAVNCDYEYLTENELKMALGQVEKTDSTIGTLTFESEWCEKLFLPVKLSDPEVVSVPYDGKSIAAVKVTVLPGHMGFVREHLTSWLISGSDKPIVARYESTTAVGEAETHFVIAKAGIWSYIWRLLVILLWLHIFIAIMVNPIVPRHAKGFLIVVPLGITGTAKPRPKDPTPINMTFSQRAIPGRWLIPFHPIKSQKNMGNNYIEFSFTYRDSKADRHTPVDKTQSKAVFKRSAVIFDRNDFPEFSGFMDDCSSANQHRAPSATYLPTNARLRELFKAKIEHNDLGAASNYIPRGSVDASFSSQRIYGFFSGGKDGLDKLDALVFFIYK